MNLNPYATVIAYFDDLVICEDDLEGLWFAEIPESSAELGSVIDIAILTELSELPQESQQNILAFLKEQGRK